MSPKLFLILGQTATGKTARAVKLAKDRGGELINCDSRQLYIGLDIITGKTDNPTDIPVHLVDIVDPHESFSAFDFAKQGIVTVRGIIARGKVPIVVGGTGNYARILLYMNPEITFGSTSSSLRGAKQRSNLIEGWDCYVLPAMAELPRLPRICESIAGTVAMTNSLNKRELQQKLMDLDMSCYNSLNLSDRENPRRLIRAIQRVENETGEILDSDSPHALTNQYEVHISVLLHKDQESLHSRIMHRIEERLKLGAMGECQSLLAKGYKPTDPGLATIGYQSIFRYIAGIVDFETMKTDWAAKERQYAKRQQTYLLKYFPQATIVRV